VNAHESRLVADYLDPWLAGLLAGNEDGPPAGEVEALEDLPSQLDRMLECARIIDAAWGGGPNSAAAKSTIPDVLPSPAISPRFGRFEIRRELGRGGSGLVFLAFDPLVQRHVALKVPQPGTFLTEEVRVRFLREARAAGLLDHPNILPVYEVAETGPVCYIASAYCPGPTLASWLRDRDAAVEPRLAARVVSILAGAVHHAHQHGILHRDLKPSNVLLFPSDDKGLPSSTAAFPFVPKVADFGLARFVDQPSDLTHTGRPLGTVSYMAPEQADGRVRDISTATDVYGLGVILYQLLTAHLPFAGESELATLQQICAVEPPAPSRRQRNIPRDLDAICVTCLHKNPSKRYGSAESLRADLQRFLGGEPILARPVSRIERGWRAVKRAPLVSALLLLTVLSVLLAIVGQSVYAHRLALALGSVQLEKSRTEAALRKVEAEQRRTRVALQRAEVEERRHRNLLYASDIRHATDAWRQADLKTACEHLDAQIPAANAEDLRGLEWHWLNAACRPDAEHDLPHGAAVTDCQVTADGKGLATCAEDGVIRLWDLESGQLAASWRAHVKAARSLAVSPDGTRLVSGGDDRLVHMWDVVRRQNVRLLGMMKTGVETVAWSPCGRWIAAGARYSEFRAWSAAGRQVLQADNDHRHEALVFSRDGTVLFVPARDDIAVWNMETCCNEKRLTTPEVTNIRAMCLTRDGRHLAVSERFDPTIAILDASTGSLVGSRDAGVDYIQHLSATADGKSILAAGPDGILRRIAVEPQPGSEPLVGGQLQVLGAHEAGCTSVRPIGESRLVTTGADGRARVWRVGQLSPWEFLGPPAQLTAAFFTGSGQQVVTALPSLEARPEFYPLSGTQPDGRAESGRFVMSPHYWSMSLSHNRRWLAIGGTAGGVGVWDLNSGRLVQRLETAPGNLSVAFSTDDTMLAATAADGSVFLFEVPGEWASDALLRHPPWPDLAAVQVRFVPHSTWLAVGSETRDTLAFLDVKSGELRRSIPTRFEGNIAVSSDGLHVAVGCDDTRLRIWRVASGELLFETEEIGSRTTALIFSPDGRTLLSAHEDGTVRMWHVPSHRSLGVLLQTSDPQRFVQSLDVSADGQQLVATFRSDLQPTMLLSRRGSKSIAAERNAKAAAAD
jgi:WD40 repeat protein